jgi:Tfp pilus assembly protein PilF
MPTASARGRSSPSPNPSVGAAGLPGRPYLRPALAAIVVLCLAAAPVAAAGRIALLPLRNTGSASPALAWIEEGLPASVGLLLAAEVGWESLPGERVAAAAASWGPVDAPPADEALRLLAAAGAKAALAGTFQAQAGSLRLQAELYTDLAAAAPPLRISLSGKLGQVPALASALAEIVGEALEQRFLRVLRPPLPSPPDFLPVRLEPSFGPKNPLENFAQSETFLLTALKIDPNNADAYAQLGVLYARNGRDEKALANLTTAVDLSPRTPRYHWDRGVALYQQGQLEEALTEFLQSTVIDETFVEGFVALASLHRRLGDREAGEAALEKALKARPEDPGALVAMGINAYLAGDAAAARALFEKARGADPRSAAASVNLALIAWDEGNLDAARKDLERALATEPAGPEALNNLGILDGVRGASEAAAEHFRRAIEAGAPKRTTLFNLGTLQLQAGQLTEAAATLQRVLDIDAEFLPARNNLGVIHLVRGQAGEAIAILAGARDDSPAAALPAYNLALAHQLGRNAQQALVHYLRALQSRRDLTAAHVNLGILFEGMGRPEKALTEYLKALSAENAGAEIYTYLGQIYAQRGYGGMADETIRKTTLVDPNLSLAWHALATNLEPLDRTKAAATWRQFLDAVRRDRNRSFWVPIAERRLAALGSP